MSRSGIAVVHFASILSARWVAFGEHISAFYLDETDSEDHRDFYNQSLLDDER